MDSRSFGFRIAWDIQGGKSPDSNDHGTQALGGPSETLCWGPRRARSVRSTSGLSGVCCQWPWRETPGSVLVDLMQEMLIFAWHTVKWDQRIARLSLGMAPAVAESIAALTPGQLTIIAGNYRGALCLRWYNQPDFWRRLLIAARDNDEEILAEIHLHAKLL